MLIDWFTVGAQALNFIILIVLLKRFLYKPILDAIDVREKRIADASAAAAAALAEAEKEKAQYRNKNEELDRQRAGLLAKANDEARAERERLIAAARQSADEAVARRKSQLDADAQALKQSIRLRAQHEVFDIARRTLTDLAGADLERRACEVFASKLRALDGPAKDGIATAARTSPEPTLVRSAFPLTPDQQGFIQNAVNEALSADVRLRFESNPSLVSGIELTAGGQKVAWSIDDYLDSLQQALEGLLKVKAASTPASTATIG